MNHSNAIKAQNLVKKCISYCTITTQSYRDIDKYFLLFHLNKQFKIQSLEAPTSAICNHNITTKPQLF